jgi:hypothetical protein
VTISRYSINKGDIIKVRLYLDCSCEFVSDVEESLHNNLVTSAPEVIELEEEPEEDFFVQTRKFFIKVLVRNESILNVRTSDFEDMGYNLKRDGWLNNFADLKNQSVRDDGVLWRGACEKRPEFTPSFSLPLQTMTILY